MRDRVKARYTLEFQAGSREAVRGGEKVASAARALGISAQSLDNWMKAEATPLPEDVLSSFGIKINGDFIEVVSLDSPVGYGRHKLLAPVDREAGRIRCEQAKHTACLPRLVLLKKVFFNGERWC